MKLRRIIGAASLLLMALALNLTVVRQEPFHWTILVSAGVALALGLVWTVLAALATAERRAVQDHALHGMNAAISTVFFLGICVMVYVFAQVWSKPVDLTEEGRRDLSPQTVKVLQSMTDEVEVLSLFLDTADETVHIARDKTERFLEQCRGYSSLLKVENLDPDTDRVRLETLQPKITHVSPQGTVVLRCKDRQKVIMLNGGSPRLEERDFTNALVNVLNNKKPVIYALRGHGECDLESQDPETGGTMLAQLLQGESYELKTLTMSITEPEVPNECDVVFIDNLGSDLHPRELEALGDFLDRGGRLLLILEPWTEVQLGASNREHLRPFLESRYGIQIGSDFVYSSDRKGKARWQAELTPDPAPFAETKDEKMPDPFHGSFNSAHPVTRAFDRVMSLAGVRTVSRASKAPQGVAVTELLRSAPDYWAETDVAGLAQGKMVSRDDNERKGPLPLAVAAVAPVRADKQAEGGPKDARILVVGDATLATNAGVAAGGNLNFILNAMAWLTAREELIAIRPSGKTDPPLVLSPPEQRAVAWISTLLPVQCVALAAVAAYVWRRRHQ